MNLVKENRVGKFTINHQIIENDPSKVARLLQGMVIVRAECMYATQCIEYLAYHQDFESVPLGQCAPTYDLGDTGQKLLLDF